MIHNICSWQYCVLFYCFTIFFHDMLTSILLKFYSLQIKGKYCQLLLTFERFFFSVTKKGLKEGCHFWPSDDDKKIENNLNWVHIFQIYKYRVTYCVTWYNRQLNYQVLFGLRRHFVEIFLLCVMLSNWIIWLHFLSCYYIYLYLQVFVFLTLYYYSLMYNIYRD